MISDVLGLYIVPEFVDYEELERLSGESSGEIVTLSPCGGLVVGGASSASALMVTGPNGSVLHVRKA